MTLSRSALLAAGLLGLAARLPAQTGLRPAVSTRPDESKQAQSFNGTTSITLRPNAELPFHVYLVNGDQQPWTNVTVRLAADARGQKPLAEGLVERVGAGEVARVALLSLAPPAPPAAPVPPAGDKEKAPPAAPKPPAGLPAPDTLYLLVLDDKKQPIAGTKAVDFQIGIDQPRNYVAASPSVSQTGNAYTLTVRLGRPANVSNAFRGKPAPARLVIRPELVPGLDPASLKDGTYQTVVAPDAKGEVVLVARNLRFPGGQPKRSVFSVSVDGYDRAFGFVTDFTGTTPSAITGDTRLVRIDAPRYGVPGRPFAARLEVFNDTGTERPRLEFHRAAEGEPEVPTAGKTTSRETTKTYRVGEAGELLFRAEVKDWVVPLDTAGIYGKRTLEFALTDENGTVLTSPRIDNPTEREPVRDVHEFTLDDTVPAGVQLLALPPKVVPKKPRKQPPPGVPLPGPSPVPGLVLPPWACECVLPPSFGVPVPLPAIVAKKEVPPPLPLVLGKTRVRGTVIELIARAEDPESGIARALLFVGAPPGPDGKSPP
ncbi:MAG TPA: hypothetical protein VFG68_20340, partial [Fimbriiglobus sp.]|nr:hypothetical protein [Fimbriiglobus sp.]